MLKILVISWTIIWKIGMKLILNAKQSSDTNLILSYTYVHANHRIIHVLHSFLPAIHWLRVRIAFYQQLLFGQKYPSVQPITFIHFCYHNIFEPLDSTNICIVKNTDPPPPPS